LSNFKGERKSMNELVPADNEMIRRELERHCEALRTSEEFYLVYKNKGALTYWGSPLLWDRMARDHHRLLTRAQDPESKIRLEEKVFGIGLAKTGTSSVAKAMSFLGYHSYHEPPYLDRLYQYDFFNDIIIAGRFEFLDMVFPNAKFILTIRDIEPWIKSTEKWWGDLSKGQALGPNGEREGFSTVYDPLSASFNRYLIYGDVVYNRENYIKCHLEHIEKVKNHFKGRENKLLVMDVCNGDGWEKLCGFLNKEVPNKNFPYQNKSR